MSYMEGKERVREWQRERDGERDIVRFPTFFTCFGHYNMDGDSSSQKRKVVRCSQLSHTHDVSWCPPQPCLGLSSPLTMRNVSLPPSSICPHEELEQVCIPQWDLCLQIHAVETCCSYSVILMSHCVFFLKSGGYQ
jgi:hypothetical protein